MLNGPSDFQNMVNVIGNMVVAQGGRTNEAARDINKLIALGKSNMDSNQFLVSLKAALSNMSYIPVTSNNA